MSLKEAFFKPIENRFTIFAYFGLKLFLVFFGVLSIPLLLMALSFRNLLGLLPLTEIAIIAGFFAVNGSLGKAILEKSVKKSPPLVSLFITSSAFSIILGLISDFISHHFLFRILCIFFVGVFYSSVSASPICDIGISRILFTFLFIFLFGFIEIKLIKRQINEPKGLFSTLVKFSFLVSIILWAMCFFVLAMSA